MIAKRILIKGKVQGVFFRKTARRIAEELHVNGWVKNTGDGNVEILAQADEIALQKLISWCKQGPPKAEVKNVEVDEVKPDNTIKYFSIEYDG